MFLIQKLKQFERQMVFLRWGGSSEYGKLKYIGADFVEFEVLDTDTMEYVETIIINSQLILEVVIGGSDIARILAEFSGNLPPAMK